MKLNSIQFLRAAAALLVVYEHSMLVQMDYATSLQQNLFHLKHFGCIGVDLFFVISGFIITFASYNYLGPIQGVHFLYKRFCRINPVYYITTFLLLIIITLTKPSNQAFSDTINKTINSVCDSLLILPVSNDINSFKPLLVVGWTLSFEWLFYILFSLLILFKLRQKELFLIGLIILLVISGQIFQSHDFRIIFITNPILLEFLLGIIICYLYLNIKRIPAFIGTTCLLLGLASYIIMIIYGYGNVWQYKDVLGASLSLNRCLLWGIPSSLIVAGCVILEKNERLSKLWSNKVALIGGDASYAIYLIHCIMLNLFILLYDKTGFLLPADVMIWVQVSIAVAASILFYRLVEKPILNYLNNTKVLNVTLASKNNTILNDQKQLAKG